MFSFRAVVNRALTHTHLHSPIPTHTQPKKGHTHPLPATPGQEKVTLTHTHPHLDKKGHTQPKEGHTHPHITEIKNVTCLTHTYKYSLFTILAGVFIFEKDWPVHLFLLNTFETAFESIVCLFVCYQQLANDISKNSKLRKWEMYEIFLSSFIMSNKTWDWCNLYKNVFLQVPFSPTFYSTQRIVTVQVVFNSFIDMMIKFTIYF